MDYFLYSVLYDVLGECPDVKLSRNTTCVHVVLFASPNYKLFSPTFAVVLRHEMFKGGGVCSPGALQGCAVRYGKTMKK